MKPLIRELTEANEVRALEPLVLEYFRVVTGALLTLGVNLDPRVPVADMMASLEKFVPPLGRAYMAERNGTTLGMACLKPLDDNRMELKRLYVRPEAQGTGLGRALLRHVEDTARGLGVGQLCLDTITPLTPAIGLYQSEGYCFIDAYDGSEAMGFDGVGDHAVFMSKAL